MNLFSGAWSFVLSLLQQLQSVTLKVGIDGNIISFLKRTVIDVSKGEVQDR